MGNMEKFLELLKDTVVNFRVKSCCCIVPLRVGTLYIAYFNLLLSLLLIVGTASESFVTMATRVQEALNEEATVSLCILPPVADLAFSVVLICGLHRRDVVLLSVYCWYGVAAIVGSAIAYSLPAIEPLINFVIILSLVYQAYVIILARSVMVEIRLENAATKNELHYDKNKDTVSIRDVEKADQIVEAHKIKEETTVSEEIETSEPSVSKTSTLKVDAQTSTRIEPGSWRTTYLTVHQPTKLEAKDTTDASIPKDSSSLKDDKSKEVEKKIEGTDSIKTEEDKQNNDNKEETVIEAKAPQRKKRGLFSRTPKEIKKKNDSS